MLAIGGGIGIGLVMLARLIRALRGNRIAFNRRSGVAEVSRGGPWQRPFPLAAIAAVQVLYAGWVRPRRGEPYRAFEMNLVQATGDRLSLAAHGDSDAMRRHAEQIADFLDVAVVDQTETQEPEPELIHE